MTTTNQQPPQFTIVELGAKFGSQLGQIYAELIVLEKQNKQLQDDLNKIMAHNDDLAEKLYQAQLDLIAAQGKAIIDNIEADTE